LQAAALRSDLLAGGDQLRVARRSRLALSRGLSRFERLLPPGQVGLEFLDLAFLFGEAAVQGSLLLLPAEKRLLSGLEVVAILGKEIAAGLEIREIGLSLLEGLLHGGQIGLSTLDCFLAGFEIGAEGGQILVFAAKGGFLPGECVESSGELLLGLLEAGGLLECLLVAAFGLLMEFALSGLELFAEFGLAALELLSLAGEVLSVALVRIHLPDPDLKVLVSLVERSLPIVEGLRAGAGRFLVRPQGCLLGEEALLLAGQVLRLGLDAAFLFEEVPVVGFELLGPGLQFLVGLFELSGPLVEVLLPVRQRGPLGILAVGSGAFLCLKGLALPLEGMHSCVEFLLTCIQFDLETFQDGTLLPELALVGDQLDLVLPEPHEEALVLALLVRRRELLVGVRFCHSRLPSYREANTGCGTPAGEFAPQSYRIRSLATTKLSLDPRGTGHSVRRGEDNRPGNFPGIETSHSSNRR
jgi:hypothetical protein